MRIISYNVNSCLIVFNSTKYELPITGNYPISIPFNQEFVYDGNGLIVLSDFSVIDSPIEVTCNCAGYTNYKKCKHSTAHRMQLELTKKAFNMINLHATLKGHVGNLSKEIAVELAKDIYEISLPNIKLLINQYRALIVYNLMTNRG